jgi:hypothetical protein
LRGESHAVHTLAGAVRRGLTLLVGASALILVAPAAPATTVTPRLTPTPPPTPQRTGDLGTKEVHGRVFDASRGPSAGIEGARVDYVNVARFPPGAQGSLVTDAAGDFTFSVFLHDTDLVVIGVVAVDQGFYTTRIEYGGAELWFASDPIEIGLQPGFCAGDCDQSGSVTIDELVLGVGIALGVHPPGRCTAMDANVDADVSVDELVAAVEHTLGGCGIGRSTPTPTSTPATTPTLCGDPSLTQRFALCQAAETEVDCVTAGGRWDRYPFSGILGCFCSTGQGGCRCTRSSDCVGTCFAPLWNGSLNGCGTTHAGHCTTEEPHAGCWCVFEEDGRSFGLCIDP